MVFKAARFALKQSERSGPVTLPDAASTARHFFLRSWTIPVDKAATCLFVMAENTPCHALDVVACLRVPRLRFVRMRPAIPP